MSTSTTGGDTGRIATADVKAEAGGGAPKPDTGDQQWRLLLPVLLMVFVGLMFGTFYLANRQAGFDAEYVGLLGEQQILSQQIAKSASESTIGTHHAETGPRGAAASFGDLERARDRFAVNLAVLRDGNPETGLPAAPSRLEPELEALEKAWERVRENVDLVLSVKEPVIAMRDDVEAFETAASRILLTSDELANALVESRAPREQVYLASRQLMLIQRISNNIRRTLEGGEGVVTAADRFGRDAVFFGRVINGMLEGDERLGIERVDNRDARAILENLSNLFEQQQQLVGKIMENSVELFRLQDATSTIFEASDEVLGAAEALRSAYLDASSGRLLSNTLGNVFGILAVICLVVLGVQLTRDSRHLAEESSRREEESRRRAEEARQREQETRDANSRNQAAILRLLDEISDLADGDLTAQATVSEDITGAIADAINFAIDALREVVTNINSTSAEVATAAQETRNTAIRLSEASERQAVRIADASRAVREMTESVEQVSDNARASSNVAEQSVTIAKKGAEAVQDTIDGMNAIRENIQETSKRIKRLGESSQEIGDIVGLIDDIADQTNILALNAAIQASMAGESGRGFAVVADEVQRLAERASQATKQIEALVKTIQSDTNEAVNSMEKTTSDVVSGADLAHGAGEDLQKIETVSQELAGLIRSISLTAEEQAGKAAQIAETTNEILEITRQTRSGTQTTAEAIGNLAELSNALKTSVADFRLPEEIKETTLVLGPDGEPVEGGEPDATENDYQAQVH